MENPMDKTDTPDIADASRQKATAEKSSELMNGESQPSKKKDEPAQQTSGTVGPINT